jgi:hypothetical protein
VAPSPRLGAHLVWVPAAASTAAVITMHTFAAWLADSCALCHVNPLVAAIFGHHCAGRKIPGRKPGLHLSQRAWSLLLPSSIDVCQHRCN